jgi:predicted amidohydrolase YtcJ
MQFSVIPAAVLILGAVALSAQKPVERPFDLAQGKPETILVNGKILAADSKFTTYEALAIKGDRITAAGTSKEMRALADAKTRIIDLGYRTVIPGMTDSHMHAIRAGLSFATEVHWIGAPTIENAIGRLRDASKRMPAGSWLIVAGGWTERQFADKRRPTQKELVTAVPDNPVYVQLGYQWALMTPKALDALNIARDEDLPAGGKLERDGNGAITGAVAGPQSVIVSLFDRLPKPSSEQKLEGTKKFFLELNRLGLTGVIDPGGNNITAPDYEALFEIWRQNQLTVRVAFSFGSQGNGGEFDEITEPALKLPAAVGDNMLRFNGVGERITGGMYNNDKPTAADKDAFEVIALWAAQRGLGLTVHWGNDASVSQLLEVFDHVNVQVPIAPLRWSIAHLNDASFDTLTHMKKLGVGWTMQDAMYFNGDATIRQRGPAARRIPPIEMARKLGVVIGAGTDAHRVASYNPFTCLQWMLDGKTVDGIAMRAAEERPTREDALRMYTSGSAWFAHADDQRGTLEVGKLADLAVLTKDYATVPVEQIGSIESLLTMVGGKVVYAAPPFSK